MKHNHDLSPTCTRRQFWRALLQEIFVIYGSAQGGHGCRLSELGSLPDDQLAQVRPVVNSDYEVFIDQAYIWSRHKKTGAIRKLFPMEKENLVVFNLFNGRHTLGEIAKSLAQEMSWDETRGFAHVRDLFLLLVSHLVCLPKDPLPLES